MYLCIQFYEVHNNDDVIIIRMHKDHNLIKHCEVSNNVSADMYTCRFTCEYMYTRVCVYRVL